MAEAAPRAPKVPGGLLFLRSATRSGLANALAISTLIHGLLFGAGEFPQLPLFALPNKEAGILRGELRAASASVEALPAVGTPNSVSPAQRQGALRRESKRDQVSAKRKLQSPATYEAPLESVAAASLSAYRLLLARQASRLKHLLPDELAGELVLAVRDVPGLPLPLVSLQHSSGNRQLDAAALEMINQAVRQAPLPLELRGHRLLIEVPLLFAPAG